MLRPMTALSMRFVIILQSSYTTAEVGCYPGRDRHIVTAIALTSPYRPNSRSWHFDTCARYARCLLISSDNQGETPATIRMRRPRRLFLEQLGSALRFFNDRRIATCLA